MNEHRSLDQLKQQQRLLQIFVFSLVTVFIWIGLSLFRTQKTSTIDPKFKQLATPLTPTIDADVISRLEQKRFYSESELQDFPIYKFLQTQESGADQLVTIDVEAVPDGPTLSSTESEEEEPVSLLGEVLIEFDAEQTDANPTEFAVSPETESDPAQTEPTNPDQTDSTTPTDEFDQI